MRGFGVLGFWGFGAVPEHNIYYDSQRNDIRKESYKNQHIPFCEVCNFLNTKANHAITINKYKITSLLCFVSL